MKSEESRDRHHRATQRVLKLTSRTSSEGAVEDLRSALEELRVAEEELRQQNEHLSTAHFQLELERSRYQELFELAPDAYLVTDLAGIVEEANQSASRLFAIPPRFLIGKALTAYVAVADRSRFRDLLRQRGQGSLAPSSFRLRSRAGRMVYAELTYSVVHDAAGTPIGFRWLIRDVTEQERLARQIRTLNADLESRVVERTADLTAAQRLSDDLLLREQAARHAAEASEAHSRHVQKLESIGVLAGGIAHDFNNLLHVVLGNADIALAHLPVRSAAREPVEEVVRATLRAADLTRQMLAYSGKGAFVVRHLDLSNEVRDMATLLRTSITKQASLLWELASDLPMVNADATQIRQIVMNLITNASDALHDMPGTIRLRTGVLRREDLNDAQLGRSVDEVESPTSGQGPLVYLEVSDSGAGMTPDTLRRIFDPFFSTKFAGRGLGLAAVMGIVRNHQGFMRIRTEPGAGTTFRVLFPAAEEPRRKLDNPTPDQSDWHGSGMALVVDDEAGVRDVAARMLEEIGFEALTAVDGQDVLDMVQRWRDRVSVVLLDLSMPRLGGQETARRLREIRPDLPIVIMSGYTSQTVDAQFDLRGSGTTIFLQKPFLAEDLVNALRHIMEVSAES
jgi:PAS domain S-box-containing protein